MAELEILRIDRAALHEETFWGGGLDLPVPGEHRHHFALVIGGWVLHREIAWLAIEVSVDDRRLARWPRTLTRPDVASQFAGLPINPDCGFVGVIPTLDLPRTFALRVEAVGKGRRALLAVIHGRRSALAEPRADEIRPALVTTLGRTGSTLLMLLLGRHPQMVVHPPFPYEARVAAYWSAIVGELVSPASYLQSLAAADQQRYWWTGRAEFPTETYVDQDPAAQWLGGGALSSLAQFARRQISGFYEISRGVQRKSGGGRCWFAEKQLPDPATQRLQRELFPDGREIFLVRDFRDMVASIAAFNGKRGYASFGASAATAAGAVDEQHLLDLGDGVENLLRTWRQAGERGLVVRYEDLVRDPGAELARVLRFLDLDASPTTIARVREEAERTDRGAQQAHATSASAAASIGRWRRDLPPALQERSSSVFAAALREWGYSP